LSCVSVENKTIRDSAAKEVIAVDMGMCFPCFKSSSTDLVTPDVVMSVSVFTAKF